MSLSRAHIKKNSTPQTGVSKSNKWVNVVKGHLYQIISFTSFKTNAVVIRTKLLPTTTVHQCVKVTLWPGIPTITSLHLSSATTRVSKLCDGWMDGQPSHSQSAAMQTRWPSMLSRELCDVCQPQDFSVDSGTGLSGFVNVHLTYQTMQTVVQCHYMHSFSSAATAI